MRNLIIGFLVTSILPLAGLSILNLRNFKSALTETVVSNMAVIADKKADKISYYIDNNRIQIHTLSYSPEVFSIFEELNQNYEKGIRSQAYRLSEIKAQLLLERMTTDYHYYDLLLINNTGDVIFSLKKESDFGTNMQTGRYHESVLADSFRQSINFLTTEFSAFASYEPSGEKDAAFTTTPLLKNGLVVGVLATQTNLENYYPIIMDDTGLGETGETLLSTGETLLSKESDDTFFSMISLRYAKNSKYVVPKAKAALPMRYALNGERGQQITVDYAGHNVVAAWRYLPDLHWGMVVKIDTDEALAPFIKLRFYTCLVLGFLITFVTAFAFFIGKSIIEPVHDLIQVTDKIAKGDLNQRVFVQDYRDDEFGELAQTFNYMADQIKQSYDHLERRVQTRTLELSVAKVSAEEALNQLKTTQDSLVQSEKMAALGGLVAGIAHEINTPVGITLTSATHLSAKTEKIAKLYEQGELDGDELETYFKVAQQSTQLMTINSQRAADLIHSFKQVAVDQTSGERREFDLKNYIEEVLLSLRPTLKKATIKILLNCPENLIINSYAGAISQILTNFVMNSLIHGYEPNQSGVLSIAVASLDSDMIELTYSDDGKGIPEELQAQIFDPFFTTRRGNGGSGLGLHVVYNLVYQTLKGSLKLQSSNNGTAFTVQFPRVLT
jgi:C4-dicarboxylate-specific signal transduction histidine kinase